MRATNSQVPVRQPATFALTFCLMAPFVGGRTILRKRHLVSFLALRCRSYWFQCRKERKSLSYGSVGKSRRYLLASCLEGWIKAKIVVTDVSSEILSWENLVSVGSAPQDHTPENVEKTLDCGGLICPSFCRSSWPLLWSDDWFLAFTRCIHHGYHGKGHGICCGVLWWSGVVKLKGRWLRNALFAKAF